MALHKNVETAVYADGTIVTGTAPLPHESPVADSISDKYLRREITWSEYCARSEEEDEA